MKLAAKKLAKKINYSAWILNGYLGRKQTAQFPEKATVLITYFNPARMDHIDDQVRNVLKCDFVENLILSNHNASIQLESRVKVRDERITFVNQTMNRGCGYRWFVADEFHPQYLMVIDDDILLFPWQLRSLFNSLVNEPEIPHGITGMLRIKGGQFELVERENRRVDYLCEVYAVSRMHLERYRNLRKRLSRDKRLAEMIDSAADFMLISKSGCDQPKIHDVGRLMRRVSYNQPGVAVHKAEGFGEIIFQVSQALST